MKSRPHPIRIFVVSVGLITNYFFLLRCARAEMNSFLDIVLVLVFLDFVNFCW